MNDALPRVPGEPLSRRIGHASTSITLNVYSHWFANTDNLTAEIMDATFAKVRSTE
jgi:hypothetical protein